ncbi:50S ribosomal protein L20 [Candidatus Microgenomates bacterium]|nr:MAG: 50S ribosomal protein L20 [Candidatus Microgenomates bacterium]
MPRTKSIASRKHKILKLRARGFKHSAGKRVKTTKEALMHAGQYAYAGRRIRRRDIRSLWIVRLNAAVREHDLSYSKFMSLLKAKNIELNRKVLSEIATTDTKTFNKIIDAARQ